MTIDEKLTEIENILADIERLDRETGGRFRQASDKEAFDLASRIERKMAGMAQSALEKIGGR